MFRAGGYHDFPRRGHQTPETVETTYQYYDFTIGGR
jgi:hypothetical protein